MAFVVDDLEDELVRLRARAASDVRDPDGVIMQLVDRGAPTSA